MAGAAYECVKYTCAPSGIAGQQGRRTRQRQAVPPDVRHLRRRRRRAQRPGKHAQTRARPAPRCCPRTATACRRRCRAAARRPTRARRIGVAPRLVERARRDRSGRRRARRCRAPTTDRRRVDGDHELRAECRKRLPHRREIAGAVVEQRDHSSPFVLGSIFASRRSLAQATRSARANALKHASILW